MACVYCIGVPLCSLVVLWWNKAEIKLMQTLQYQIEKKSHKQLKLKLESEEFPIGSPQELQYWKRIKESAREERLLLDRVWNIRESNYVLEGVAVLYVAVMPYILHQRNGCCSSPHIIGLCVLLYASPASLLQLIGRPHRLLLFRILVLAPVHH